MWVECFTGDNSQREEVGGARWQQRRRFQLSSSSHSRCCILPSNDFSSLFSSHSLLLHCRSDHHQRLSHFSMLLAAVVSGLWIRMRATRENKRGWSSQKGQFQFAIVEFLKKIVFLIWDFTWILLFGVDRCCCLISHKNILSLSSSVEPMKWQIVWVERCGKGFDNWRISSLKISLSTCADVIERECCR